MTGNWARLVRLMRVPPYLRVHGQDLVFRAGAAPGRLTNRCRRARSTPSALLAGGRRPDGHADRHDRDSKVDARVSLLDMCKHGGAVPRTNQDIRLPKEPEAAKARVPVAVEDRDDDGGP